MGQSSIKTITKNLILQHKYITLTNFRRLKNQRYSQIEELKKFNLRNSLIPAIQGHVMNNIPSSRRDSSALSNYQVFSAY